jgi:hypothetical protein
MIAARKSLTFIKVGLVNRIAEGAEEAVACRAKGQQKFDISAAPAAARHADGHLAARKKHARATKGWPRLTIGLVTPAIAVPTSRASPSIESPRI